MRCALNHVMRLHWLGVARGVLSIVRESPVYRDGTNIAFVAQIQTLQDTNARGTIYAQKNTATIFFYSISFVSLCVCCEMRSFARL